MPPAPPPAPPTRIGLVSQCPDVPYAEIARVAAALDTQVKRDLLPLWGIHGSVEPLPDPSAIPPGLSPIFIRPDTPGSVGGLHTQAQNGRAFAVVLSSRDWALSSSHECLELLIDPAGNRTQPGRSLQLLGGAISDGDTRVDFVVEACDPLEDPANAYDIDGTTVSDFYTLAYFDDAATPGTRYSHTGAITRPRQVNLNGYVSWIEPTGQIRQLRNFGIPTIMDLPNHAAALTADGLSLREFIDRNTPTPRTRKHPPSHPPR